MACIPTYTYIVSTTRYAISDAILDLAVRIIVHRHTVSLCEYSCTVSTMKLNKVNNKAARHACVRGRGSLGVWYGSQSRLGGGVHTGAGAGYWSGAGLATRHNTNNRGGTHSEMARIRGQWLGRINRSE